MKLLDRYLLWRYLICLALSLVGLLSVSVVVDLIERIDMFIVHDAAIVSVLAYYIYRTPYWIILTLPIATLLATMFSLTSLARRNEVTAMKAAGLSLYRILAPIFAFSVLFSGLAFVVVDQVLPRATFAYNTVRNQIRSHDRADGSRRHLLLQDVEGQILFAGSYDAGKKTARRVSWEQLSGSHVQERRVGDRMVWRGDGWILYEAHRYLFATGAPTKLTRLDSIAMEPLTLRAADLARQQKKPEEMNYAELSDYIARARANGEDVTRHLVDLYLKISFPVTCLIIVVVGAPFAANARRAGLANSFGLGALICFTFYSLVKAGQALGWNQIVAPLTGAWMGNLVFLLIGIALLVRAHK